MPRPIVLACCVLAAPAFAGPSVLTIAKDRYEAGAPVSFAGPAVDDLFVAGNRVTRQSITFGGAALLGLGGATWAGWRRMGSAGDLAAVTAGQRQVLPETPLARDLIRHATRAANGHNTQAWRFHATDQRIQGSALPRTQDACAGPRRLPPVHLPRLRCRKPEPCDGETRDRAPGYVRQFRRARGVRCGACRHPDAAIDPVGP